MRTIKPPPEADYYLFMDERFEALYLYNNHQYDYGEMYSGELAEENVEIYDRRMELLVALKPELAGNPDLAREMLYQLYWDAQVSFSADMIHPISWYSTRLPARIDHCEDIACLTPKPAGGYVVVSAAWKQAIESLEPNVHEFFPHRLCFMDAEIDGFVFRNRNVASDFLQPIGRGVPNRSNEVKAIYAELGLFHEPTIGTKPVSDYQIAMNRVSGLHWLVSSSPPLRLVSKELATRLVDLLPGRVVLLPMASAPAVVA